MVDSNTAAASGTTVAGNATTGSQSNLPVQPKDTVAESIAANLADTEQPKEDLEEPADEVKAEVATVAGLAAPA